MTNIDNKRFLIGCAIGDGCISKSKSRGVFTLHIQRKEAHWQYANWQLENLNNMLNTKAKLKYFLDKGKYPAVRFGVTNKEFLSPVYELLYPAGIKTLSVDCLQQLTKRELALFWMDDGSLEVRKRVRPTGSIKYERTAWLAVCEDLDSVKIVGDWIHDLTTAKYTFVRHKSGKYYLRWNSAQCKTLINSIKEYVLPCLEYKVDLSRTVSVKQWLSESNIPVLEKDDKMARAPRALTAKAKGDDIV